MEVAAQLNNLRIASRKVRLVADLVRHKKADKALALLSFSPQRSAKIMAKLLHSALANAKNNFQLEEANLYVAKVLVDDGAKLKRWRPRSRGRAFPIQKKTCHVTIILRTLEKVAVKKVSSKKDKTTEPLPTKSIHEVAKAVGSEKPKARPIVPKIKPKSNTAIQRIFRRKAF